MMEIRQIKYFLAIQEHGSFTRAAEQLYITQPALSAAIKALEKELDSTLLNRLPKRVTLTPAGVRFRDRAFSILAEVNAARNELKSFKYHQQPLRIAILNTLNTPPVQQLLLQFKQQHPDIHIHLSNANLQTLAHMMGQDKADLIITNLSGDTQANTTQLFYQERYQLVVAPDHPLAQQPHICLADLHGQPFVLRKQCEVLSEAQRLFMMEQAQPEISCRTDQDEWALTMVRSSGSAAIMAQSCELSGLIQIPISDFDLKRAVGCQWRAHNNHPSLANFINNARAFDFTRWI